MKALLVSAAAIGLLAATPAFASAGPQSQAQAGASAEIVAPISVVSDGTSLNFGRIAAGNGGTVTVDGAGTLTSSDPNMLIVGSTGSAAGFNVTGGAGLAYTRTVDATVAVGDMTATLVPYGGAASLSDPGGLDSFKVGGTLTVPAGHAAGNFSGLFTVKVQYN